MKKYTILMMVGILVGLFAVTAMASVTLSLITSPDNGPSLQWLAQQFEKQNPDIKINVSIVSWETLYPRLLADLRARSGVYDIFTWDVMTAGSIHSGALDLTKFFKEHSNLVPKNYDWKDLLPLAERLGEWNGDLIGLPYYNNTMLFYYRKDLFDNPKYQKEFYNKFGRPLRVPTTWAEAVDVARFFTKKYNPNSPTRFGIALMFPTTHTMFYMFPLFFGPYRRSPDGVREFGPVNITYGDYFTSNGKPAFANKYGLMALEDMKALMPYAPDPLGSDYGQTIEYFSQGMTAMCPQWTNPYMQFKSSPALQPASEKIGIAPMPGRSVAGNWALGISKYIPLKKQIAAAKFILFATSKWATLHVLEKFGIAPIRESVLDNPEAQKAIPWVKALPAIYQTETFRPRIPQEPQLESITDVYFSEMLSGKIPMTIESLKKLAQKWEKVLSSK